jgi:hypothetical protein
MEQNQFFGGPFALGILNPHTGLVLCAAADDKKQSERQGVSNKSGYCVGGGRTGVKGGERQDTHVAPVLPERAPSEGPRSTAAIGATWVPCRGWNNERAWRDHLATHSNTGKRWKRGRSMRSME